MLSRVRPIVLVSLVISMGLAYGCSSDDGETGGTGGADSGGGTGKGGAQATGGRAAGGGTVTLGGTANGGSNVGGAAGSANVGGKGGVPATGGAATGGPGTGGNVSKAGATSTGGVANAAGAGGSAIAGNAGKWGVAGAVAGNAGTATAGTAGRAAGAPGIGGAVTGTGGAHTGGAATGGAATGGAATGGAATGGAATGGAATGGAGPGNSIPTIITYWGSDDCRACLAENCSSPDSTVGADVYSPTGESCDQLTGADATLCYTVLTCELQTDCTSITQGAVTPCYCGTSTNCIGGVGVNGPCKAQIEAGLKSTDASFIAANFGATSLPGGRANALVQCAVNGIQYGGPSYSGDVRCTKCFSATPAN